MDINRFNAYITENAAIIEKIKSAACELHEDVNQKYADSLPYGYHLERVAMAAIRYGKEIIMCEDDILPVIFGAYFHDSIEDARLTYNDVVKVAKKFMDGVMAIAAAEIVYALTNEKGRTREERADRRYYEGIKVTPYAPFVKLCDRFANMQYSYDNKSRMLGVYGGEWKHFIEAIKSDSDDVRFGLPEIMIKEIEDMLA